MIDAETPKGTRVTAADKSGPPQSTVTEVTRQPPGSLGPRANRTIARILDATREVFLTRGYAGTTIDEIATTAGISRASFYTYFPTKRDVLLAVGARSASEALLLVRSLAKADRSPAGLDEWAGRYLALLDVHGAFAFGWTQAAQGDTGIRVAGMRTHLDLCRRCGEALAEVRGAAVADPVALGLLVFSMLERSWDYSRLYADAIERTAIQSQVAALLWGAVEP